MIKDIAVLPHQKDFINSVNPTTGLVAGFGAGKSYAGTLKTIIKKLQYPSVKVAYYLPNYPLIRDIAFEKFPEMCNDLGLHYQLNKSYKELIIKDFGTIIFRNMSEPDMIVGYEVGYSLIDECDVMPKHKMDKAFKQILARNRAPLPDKKPNQVDLVGTPEGYKFYYNLMVANKPDNYRLIKARTVDNPHLPPDYIETLKDTYDEKLLKQYLLGEFINVNGSAIYHQFDRDVHVIPNIRIDPYLPLIISFDFNINPYNAIYLIQVIDGKVTVIDNAILKGKPLVDSLDYLKEKFSHLGAGLFSATIYGDAAGKARSQGTAQSNYDLIKNAGFHKMKIKTANPRVADRINALNSMLRNGKGDVNIGVCERNQELIVDLEQMSYNDKGEVDKSNQDLSHAVDSVGYYIEYEHSLHKTEVKNIRMRVG
jgi:PBSX family phage terminase large subunit